MGTERLLKIVIDAGLATRLQRVAGHMKITEQECARIAVIRLVTDRETSCPSLLADSFAIAPHVGGSNDASTHEYGKALLPQKKPPAGVPEAVPVIRYHDLRR